MLRGVIKHNTSSGLKKKKKKQQLFFWYRTVENCWLSILFRLVHQHGHKYCFPIFSPHYG